MRIQASLVPALVAAALAPAVLSTAQTPPAAPQPPVFGAGVEAVYVDVFVSSNGRPVTGLSAADFELKDNGVAQAVELLAQEQAPTHALLLLDTSNSVRGKLDALKQAAKAFLDGLRPGDKASVLTFNQNVRARQVGGDAASARAALDQARAEGGTALYDALYVALGLGDPREGRPVIVVFSDGDDRLSWLSADKVLGVARQSDAAVYAVDTTEAGARPDLPRSLEASTRQDTDRSSFLTGRRGVDVRQGPNPRDAPKPSLLQRAATETGGQVFPVAGGDLKSAFLGVLGDLKSRYVLRFEPKGVPRAGWHELSVRLKGRGGDLRVRKGYFVADSTGAAPAS